LKTHWVVDVVGTSNVEQTVSEDLIDAMRAAGGSDILETLYLACLPPQYTLLRWTAQKIAPVRYAYQYLTRDAAGTHASGTETANQAAVITLRTKLAGRKDISNKHIGPIPQAATVQADGLIVAAYKTLLNNLGIAMVQQISTPGTDTVFLPCVRHNDPPNSLTVLFQAAVGETVNVMRRRTVGRGI